MRTLVIVVLALAFIAPVVTTGRAALAEPDPDHASCMGLGSFFYATFAVGQRADVSQIVREAISAVPGEHYRLFAQEKEGGSIPEPCGTRIE